MPARKSTDLVKDPSLKSILVVVGQLLEATKAASEGIKSLSAEVRSNATAIITAAKTLEVVEETVCQLNDIVRTNPDSLMHTVEQQSRLVDDLDKAHASLNKAVTELTTSVNSLRQSRVEFNTMGNVVYYVIIVTAWLATTGIALYAVVRGK